MDLVQEPVRRLGHISTKKICSTCRIFLPYKDYYPREWQKREKRTCTECRKNEHTTAAAPGIPSSSPEGQHGALSTHTPTPFNQHGAAVASSKDAQCTATPVAATVAHARLDAMALSLFSSPTVTRLLRWCHVCPQKMATQKRGRKQQMVPWQGMDCS